MFEINWNDDAVIDSIKYGGKNIILPWGIEFADSVGFFSLTGEGMNCDIDSREITKLENGYCTSMKIKLREAFVQLDYSDIYESESNTIRRTACLTALEDSFLLDFVLRYRFVKDFFDEGGIMGHKIEHRGLNIYHQYSVKEAFLRNSEEQVTIKIEQSKSDDFNPFMYIRDAKVEWVIHARLLPNKADKYVLKVNASWHNRALRTKLAAPILAISKIRNKILYWAERKPGQTRPRFISRYVSAYPLVCLKKGESIYLETSANLSKFSDATKSAQNVSK